MMLISHTTDTVQNTIPVLQDVSRFAIENRLLSWRLFIETLLCIVLVMGLIVILPVWYLKLPAALLLGLVQVRLFGFYHDYMHKAQFANSRVASVLMRLVGWYLLTPQSLWLETHNYHHRNNSRLVGSSIGSFPLVSTDIWKTMNTTQRFMYRLIRHPVNMLFGYLTIFIYGMLVSPFLRSPKKNWEALFALFIHLFLIVLSVIVFDWQISLFVIVVPAFVSMATGSYLFYVQHNFPGIKLRDRQIWDYKFAALFSSSMFKMPRLMHWFTANIGYHHVHHINSRIPFYNLPEASEQLGYSSKGDISWTFNSIRDCFSLAIWNHDKQRMLSYQEADRL